MFLALDLQKIIGFSWDNFTLENLSFFVVVLFCIIFTLIAAHKIKYHGSEKMKKNLEYKLALNKQKIQQLSEKLTSVYSDDKKKIKVENKISWLNSENDSIQEDLDEFPYIKPKGIVNLLEMAIELIHSNVIEIMGYRFENFTGYILALGLFMLSGFVLGLTGFIANPFVSLSCTLTISIVTFVMIHATSVKYKHWGYFNRFIEPVFIFLPINLITMWGPLISLACRLFGNALAGWCIMTLVYAATDIAIGAIHISLAPAIAPFLHAYFDIFSGAIQTIVFCLLTMIFVSQEAPELEDPVADVTFSRA